MDRPGGALNRLVAISSFVVIIMTLFGGGAPRFLVWSREMPGMRLTSYTNYALRILMYCALHPGQLVRIADISESYGISKAHLLKATRQLGQLGYLENVRGRAGGVRLGLEPERIVVGEVVRHTEDQDEFVECFNAATNTCPLLGVCKLSLLFRSGLEAFFAELDKVTVADLVSHGPVLLERLAPERVDEPAPG